MRLMRGGGLDRRDGDKPVAYENMFSSDSWIIALECIRFWAILTEK